LGLSALLGVAVWLTPDRHGHGTHQQLGLPPCTFYVLFGRPCPACGMTTSWAWLVRGEVIEACRANVGGTLLAALAIAGVPWLLGSALRGRWLTRRPNDLTLAGLVGGMLLVTLVQWGWRLSCGSF